MPASFSSKAHRAVRSIVVITLFGVVGCTQPDIDRPGTWKATGVNDQNLSAMLANPNDLNYGSGAITARGDSGARAVTRLLTDKRRQLLNVSIARIGSAGDSPADSAGPSTSGGGGATGAAQ